MNKMKMIKMALVLMGGVMYAELSVEQGKQIEEGISRYLAARYEDEYLTQQEEFLYTQLSEKKQSLDFWQGIIRDTKESETDVESMNTAQKQYDDLQSNLLSVQQKRAENSQPDNILTEITAILNAEKQINVSDIIAQIQKCGEIERNKAVAQFNIQKIATEQAVIQKQIGDLYSKTVRSVNSERKLICSQAAEQADRNIASYITQTAELRAKKEILENSITSYEQQEKDMITEIMKVINQYVVVKK